MLSTRRPRVGWPPRRAAPPARAGRHRAGPRQPAPRWTGSHRAAPGRTGRGA